MGRDITTYAEVRDNETNTWHILPIKRKTTHYVASDPEKPHILDKKEYEWVYASPYTSRNYDLFEILNGDAYNAILDYPRGFPPDVSEEVKDLHEEWYDTDFERYICFDETWYTLAELEAALSNKDKYPKWEKWVDEDGKKHKEAGIRWDLKQFVNSVRYFVSLSGWYDSNDVRVIMWFDW